MSVSWYTADDSAARQRVLAAWKDAPVMNTDVLGMLLDTARAQVLAYAPALPTAPEHRHLGLTFSPLGRSPKQGVVVRHSQDLAGEFTSLRSHLWNNPDEIALFSGRPVPVDPANPGNGGCKSDPSGGGNLQPVFFSTVTPPTNKIALIVIPYGESDLTVYVDGEPATATPIIVNPNKGAFVVLDGLGPGAHNITGIVGPGLAFVQVITDGGRCVAGPVPDWRIALVGNSFGDLGQPPYIGSGTAPAVLYDRTGCEIIPLAQGSTSYTGNLDTGAPLKSKFGSPERLAVLRSYNPDLIIVEGTINDGPAPGQPLTDALLASIEREVAAFLAAVAPTPVIVLPRQPLGLATPESDALNAAVVRPATAAPNAQVIDWYSESWLTGTGSAAHPKGDGNQDIYIGADDVHPSYAGALYLWERAAERVARVLAQGFYAPAEYPARYALAQLMQARNLFEAGTVSSSGEIGDGSYSFTPRPMDKTIRGIIRPEDGKPDVL